MKTRQLLQLLGWRFYLPLKNFLEYLKVVFRFYRNPSFRKADFLLTSHYLFRNPFRICRDFLKHKKEEEPYSYGETPLTSFELISKESEIEPNDTLFELGSGRGRLCFWASLFLKCRVVGVEFVPHFSNFAEKVRQKFHLKRIEFRQENILETDLKGATVLYFYGICSKDSFIRSLAKRLQTLPKGTKIITVSFALSEYATKPLFKTIKSFPVSFQWGKADVYLQIRN